MIQHYLTRDRGLVVLYRGRINAASYSYPSSDNATRYARLKTPAARYRFARQVAADELRGSRYIRRPELVRQHFEHVAAIPAA